MLAVLFGFHIHFFLDLILFKEYHLTICCVRFCCRSVARRRVQNFILIQYRKFSILTANIALKIYLLQCKIFQLAIGAFLVMWICRFPFSSNYSLENILKKMYLLYHVVYIMYIEFIGYNLLKIYMIS